MSRSDEWVAQVGEDALDFFALDLVVGQGGLGDGVPVDEAFAAVDEAITEEAEECLADSPGADLVHREPLAVPVAAATHGLELARDLGLVLVLEGLDLGDELLTREVGAFLALVGEDAFFDDGLGGDARIRW